MKTNPTEQLSTVALVKAEFASGLDTSVADSDIQEYIDDLSQDWLQRCGVYSLSTLYTFTDVYDGSGTRRLKVRQVPLNSVTTLMFGVTVIPQSTTPTQNGWGIESNGNFIFLRGYWFPKGIQNVTVTGNAGNDGIPGDVQRAFTRHCAIEFKRKDSINVKSLSLSSGGTTTYLTNDELPPDIQRVIRNHSRLGM
jgi:hypothetical protein